jgi:hypothetical protein
VRCQPALAILHAALCGFFVKCSSLCDANDADCCCEPSAVLSLRTTIDDSSYGPQGSFVGWWGYNHSAHSVRFVPPAVTGLPTGSNPNYTRTLTYEVCMTANNGEDGQLSEVTARQISGSPTYDVPRLYSMSAPLV